MRIKTVWNGSTYSYETSINRQLRRKLADSVHRVHIDKRQANVFIHLLRAHTHRNCHVLQTSRQSVVHSEKKKPLRKNSPLSHKSFA